MPSPSVSRWTVTLTTTSLDSVPLVTLTGSSTSRCSSSLPQSSMVGVPVSFPWGLTAMPKAMVPLMVEPSLLGVTTVTGVMPLPSSWGVGFFTATSRAAGA